MSQFDVLILFSITLWNHGSDVFTARSRIQELRAVNMKTNEAEDAVKRPEKRAPYELLA